MSHPSPAAGAQDGVFEAVRVEDARAFAWTRHLTRWREGAVWAGLAPPDSSRVGVEAARAVAAAGGTCRLRLIVTGAGWRVTAAPLPPPSPVATLATSPWRRHPPSATAGRKATSYVEEAAALSRARASGADEALILTIDDRICEGATSTVAVVVGGRALTPPLAAGCLAGVGRALLLEAGMLEETDVPLSLAHEAEEIVLVGALRGVRAVVAWDGVRLRRGPVGLAMRAAWDALARDLGEPLTADA